MSPVVAVLAFAAPAAAQYAGTPGFPTSSTSGLPGSATSSLPGTAPAAPEGLALTASAEVLYDSNELRTDFAVLPGTMQHRDDFRYSPLLAATYGRSTGRIALAVNGEVGHDFFQYNHYLDSGRYVGGGSLTYHRGSSCQVSVNGNFTSRQGGILGTDQVLDPTTGVIDDVGTVINNVISYSTYGANLGCGSPSGRLSFGGGYNHSSISNASLFRKFGDSDSDTYSGNIGIGILRPGQLSLNGSYSTIAYPGRTALAPAPGTPPQLLGEGVKTYRIGLTFSRPIGTRLSGSIGASYLHSDPGAAFGAYSSPAYNVSLAYIASPRLSFSLLGSRDVVPSTTTGAQFRVVDTLDLEGQYRLGQHITIRANGGFIINDYKQAFAIIGEPARTSDTTANYGISILYAPRRLYDIALNVQHTARTSDPTLFNYSGTRVGLTLAVHH